MTPALRNAGAGLLAVLGLAACQPPEPPVQAPAGAPAAGAPAHVPVAADAAVEALSHAPIDDAAPAAAAAGDDAPAVVSVALDHAGELLVGQSRAELDALGSWTSVSAVESCEYLEGSALPAGIAMMVEQGRVVRFDLGAGGDLDAPVDQPGPFGLRVGMTRAQAVAAFPSAPVSSPHDYNGEQGEYLTWQDPGSDLGGRVELFEGKVVQVIWGTSDAIELNEGCA